MKKNLGVLGCGNMGSAIVLGLHAEGGAQSFSFFTYTPTHKRAAKLAQAVGGRAVRKLVELKTCEYFLIACKPQQFSDLAKDLKKITGKDSKIISVMAGISVAKIKKMLGVKKVARVMPNTPCMIGCGTAALYFSDMNATEKKTVAGIFSAIAHVYIVQSENAMNAATAIIGAGPGLIFEITRLFAAKTEVLGFSKKIANEIVKDMIFGAASLMIHSKETPETLRNKVTSKKGVTEAALEIFQNQNLEKTLQSGLEAAFKRAKELSK